MFDQIEQLRAVAGRCRKLAETASDGGTAAVLRQIANDIGLALPVLEAALKEHGS